MCHMCTRPRIKLVDQLGQEYDNQDVMPSTQTSWNILTRKVVLTSCFSGLLDVISSGFAIEHECMVACTKCDKTCGVHGRASRLSSLEHLFLTECHGNYMLELDKKYYNNAIRSHVTF